MWYSITCLWCIPISFKIILPKWDNLHPSQIISDDQGHHRIDLPQLITKKIPLITGISIRIFSIVWGGWGIHYTGGTTILHQHTVARSCHMVTQIWVNFSLDNACCLTATHHFLHKFLVLISEVLWHSLEIKFAGSGQAIDHVMNLEIKPPKLLPHLPEANESSNLFQYILLEQYHRYFNGFPWLNIILSCTKGLISHCTSSVPLRSHDAIYYSRL